MWKTIWRKEFLSVVGNKWYWVAAIFSPMIMVLWLFGPGMIDQWLSKDKKIAYYLGESQLHKDTFAKVLAKLPDLQFIELSAPPDEEIHNQVRKGDITAILDLSNDLREHNHPKIYTKNVGHTQLFNRVQAVLSEEVRAMRVAEQNWAAEDVEKVFAPIVLEVQQLTKKGQNKGLGERVWVAYGVMCIIFVMILVFGMMILNGMCQEKSTKMVEVVLSCTSPDDLVMGKVTGITSAALLQLTIWGLVMGVGIFVGSLFIGDLGAAAATSIETESFTNRLLQSLLYLPTSFWIYTAMYTSLGVLLYVMGYAAIGSTIENMEDGQHLQFPLNLLLQIPLLLSFWVKAAPDSIASVLFSLFPFFSPMLMPMRLSLSEVPTWEVALSLVLLVLAILGIKKMAAKIYRVGLLMSGKPPKMEEVMRWLRQA